MKGFKKYSFFYIAWSLVFTIIPFIIMVIFAFSTIERLYILNYKENSFSFSVNHFSYLLSKTFYKPLFRSVKYALISTFFCLIIGYPIAYIISRLRTKYKYLILLLFIFPMWTNLILRVTTLNEIFSNNSFLTNVFCIKFFNLSNLISLKIIIILVISSLPFMIFPIYISLEKQDKRLLEASSDLGCSKFLSFIKITLPLSLPGISSGIQMVFLPSVMSYSIPQIVSNGNSDYTMIGQILERYFMSNSPTYNIGSLVSLIIVIFTLSSFYIIIKLDKGNYYEK